MPIIPDNHVWHPVWCDPEHCTAHVPGIGAHQSALIRVEAVELPEAHIDLRLFAPAYEEPAAAVTYVELTFTRTIGVTSVEAYNLRPGEAVSLAGLLAELASAAGQPS